MTTPAEESLHQIVRAFGTSHPEAEGRQKDPLLHQLLLTIFRKRVQMDALLAKKTRKLRPELRPVFWWALAELFWMDGLPQAVVVNTAVDYVKQRWPRLADFTNGVLRGICREPRETLWKDFPESVKAGLPRVLWQRWCRNYGREQARQMGAVLQMPAETVLRRSRWMSGRPVEPFVSCGECSALPSAPWAEEERLFLWHGKNLDSWMASGEWYVQDPATLMAPEMLAVQPGEDVADLCCAPGGKARILAERLQGRGTLFCGEKVAEKLELIRQNLRGYSNVSVQSLDASTGKMPEGGWDAVMLDVPCSNTGVIRRRPDVRFAFTEARLAAHVSLQKAILEHVAPCIRPGGRLCYSTCSIEPEENQEQVRSFLALHPEFSLVRQEQLLPETGSGSRPPHDGGFAALLQRKS